jgi:hypothetical protein
MRIWFLLGVSLMLLGITLAIQDKLEREYERGYQDAIRSLSTRQVDNLCIKWWFQSDLEAAKKRACGK